ncbi:MAG TPA: 50S ribosomal protein L29 [Candidatus Paceibacterota bacterium]|jgi:ribosomal protein L29|nr:50S ribosomal protein L29 [Candidatus Paceibacterota bacterium]
MANIFKSQEVNELQHALAEKREAFRAFRFGAAGSRSRNVREGRNLRKEIAQILTELRARELSNTK